MKITPQHFPQEVEKPRQAGNDSAKTTAEQATAEKAAGTVKADASRQRMLSWFARVGISPSLMSSDPKKQKHALERRKQILETQKASNLQAVLNIALNVTINQGNRILLPKNKLCSEFIGPASHFEFASHAGFLGV
ncbi:MAG: hypothetical protein U9Q87_02960 [Pseudomonadota bacterium]|nr:hypothetical protein [Pseudomonadota bacterium]